MDFAILLFGNFKDPYDFVGLIGELATVLNVKDEKINLVVLNDADLELAYKVISEGSVVFERDVEKRVDFEVRVLKSYLNFKPVLDQKHHPAIWMPHASNNLKTITIQPKLTKRTT